LAWLGEARKPVSDEDRWVTLRAVVELRVAKTTNLTSKRLVLAVDEALDKKAVLKGVNLLGRFSPLQLGAIKVKEYARVRAAETMRVIKGEEV
jgi:hypothetical protein